MSSTPSSGFTARQRPGDRVREYVLSLPEQNGSPRRLPTMRDLAAHLGVSLATVHTVYQELKKQGLISTRTGDGSYLLPVASKKAPPTAGGERRRIYFNDIPKREELHLSLQGAYYAALMQQVMEQKLRYDFSVLDPDGAPSHEQVIDLYRSGQLDAMIIFPFTPSQPLIDACEQHRVPYVTFHPASPAAVTSYVTPDFFQAGVRIANAIAATDRKRVAFLTYGDILASSTAWALSSGVTSGLLDLGRPVQMERASFRGLPELRDHFGAWLDKRKGALPDVILCHRHGFWQVVEELLKERGLTVPGDVSLITTLHQETSFDSTGATRLILPFSQTARIILRNLCALLEQDTPMLPATRLDIPFAGGATTLPGENALLGLC